MMRPFMHQVTIDKVCVYGFDKNEWKSALLKDIDADQLPAHYGGTLTDPATGDPKCPHKVISNSLEKFSLEYLTNNSRIVKHGR
jgi:hypothetical protein